MCMKDKIKDLMLLQANNVTFGQYSITEWQDNVLTLIYEQLQKHMTNNGDIAVDLFGQPYVTICCDEVGGKNHKSYVLKEVKDMRKKDFSFRWKHPKSNREIETTGSIITTVHNEVGTNYIRINFNPWAIPFLLYYGKGVGGTFFSKSVALSLRGDMTKRIYKIICSQANNTEYYYPISQFRKDFELGGELDNYYIKKNILEKARVRIKESDSSIWFDYELITRFPKNNGRKPKADTILFKIKSTKATGGGGQQRRNDTIYRWLTIAMGRDHQGIDKAFTAILESDRTDDFYNRLCYWDDQISNGEKTTNHVINSILKILRDDYKIAPHNTTK